MCHSLLRCLRKPHWPKMTLPSQTADQFHRPCRGLTDQGLNVWEAGAVRQIGSFADRFVLETNPAVQACGRRNNCKPVMSSAPIFVREFHAHYAQRTPSSLTRLHAWVSDQPNNKMPLIMSMTPAVAP